MLVKEPFSVRAHGYYSSWVVVGFILGVFFIYFFYFVPLLSHHLQSHYVYYGSPLSSVVIIYSATFWSVFFFTLFCLFFSSSTLHDLVFCTIHFTFCSSNMTFLSIVVSSFSLVLLFPDYWYFSSPIIVLLLLFDLLYIFEFLFWRCFILNASISWSHVCLNFSFVS